MVEKLLDKLKELPAKFMEWWNKFSPKKKTAIICVSLGILAAFAILITIVTRTQYTEIVTCENTTQAAEVKQLLTDNDILFQVSDDGLVFSVDSKQLSNANILLGSNNIMTSSFSINNVVDGGFSVTESDKQKLYVVYLEKYLGEILKQYDFVDSATVSLNMPEDNGTLIAKEQESYASVLLKLNGTCEEETANAIARLIKTAIGNETTENIVIMDTEGNLLFSGGDELSIAGSASSQLSAKQQAEAVVKSEVKSVLLGTNEFDLIEVASNLTLDFSEREIAEHNYTPAEGQTQGVLSHESVHESETTGGTSGVPGTDSNGNETYVYSDGTGGSSSVSEYDRDYLPNEYMSTQTIPGGSIVYNESSIAVSTITYKVIRQEDVKSQGLLDGITWDDYKLQNGDRVKREVDADLYNIVSNATGIATEDITIVSYEEPFFVDSEGLKIDFAQVFQIVLIVIILCLLGYVVIRSLKSNKAKEEEPEELSVENLLQSMPADPLEDIELETKSETRKMIEKFVDENPDAVANLLRNWLNEDWG